MKSLTLRELDDFTYDCYTRLLTYLKKDYDIIPFYEVNEKRCPYLILRHDVDWSLSAALKIAQLESSLGIKSSYFFLLSNSVYDILEEQNTKIVREISQLGHEIGLHYYPSGYRSMGKNMNQILKGQVQKLERISGKRVISIARHGPWDRDPFATIKGFVNANHPFLRGDLFVHDSCRAWAPLDGMLRLLNNKSRKVQLLTHCENWQETRIDRKTLFKRLVRLSKQNPQLLEKHLRKGWFEDTVILEYDKAVERGYYTQKYGKTSYLTSEYASNSRSKRKYFSLVNWYLINTRIGWQYHKILQRLRSSLCL